MGRSESMNQSNNERRGRGGKGNRRGGGGRGNEYKEEKDDRNGNGNEQGRTRGNRRAFRGRSYRGGNYRGGNFRGYNRFNNDRGEQFGPEIEPNFDPNFRDNREILNQEFQNRNDNGSFPKFKDDDLNIFMPRQNNRRNVENLKPLMGYFDYPQHSNNIVHPNNNTVNSFEFKINQQDIQKETIQSEIQETTNVIEQDKGKNTETPRNLLINIKKESPTSTKKPIQKPVPSSSSDSSSSESDDSTMEKLKKSIKAGTKLSKKDDEKKIILPKPKIKQEPGVKHSEKDSSSDSSSSSDSEESSSPEELIKKTKKKKSEEEVICLGKLEKFENLIDDEETNSSQINANEIDFCILCDKKDHTSFHCQMICKNCGAQYHNLKNCPKPANLSMMLQNFLEFCLNQCTMYNPDQRFSFRNGNVQTELLPAVIPSSTRNLNDNISNLSIPDEYSGPTKSKKIRLKSHSENLSNSKFNTSFKNKNYSDSEPDNSTDSSISLDTTSSSKRKRKRQKVQSTTQNNTYPGGMGFTSPFAFNPMMAAAFSQMMGFNPAAGMNFTTNVNKEK